MVGLKMGVDCLLDGNLTLVNKTGPNSQQHDNGPTLRSDGLGALHSRLLVQIRSAGLLGDETQFYHR